MSKLKKKCFIDKIPENGWYFFKECGKSTWIITDKIKILRVISESERHKILKKAGYNEEKEWIPYKLALEKRIKTVA